jgi:hypothetical protein
MIGVVLILIVVLLIAESEIERKRAAKRAAELYRRDEFGRWE